MSTNRCGECGGAAEFAVTSSAGLLLFFCCDCGEKLGKRDGLPRLLLTGRVISPVLATLGPTRCRHVVEESQHAMYLVTYYAMMPDEHIMRDTYDQMIICVSCMRMLSDFADGTREKERKR